MPGHHGEDRRRDRGNRERGDHIRCVGERGHRAAEEEAEEAEGAQVDMAGSIDRQ